MKNIKLKIPIYKVQYYSDSSNLLTNNFAKSSRDGGSKIGGSNDGLNPEKSIFKPPSSKFVLFDPSKSGGGSLKSASPDLLDFPLSVSCFFGGGGACKLNKCFRKSCREKIEC